MHVYITSCVHIHSYNLTACTFIYSWYKMVMLYEQELPALEIWWLQDPLLTLWGAGSLFVTVCIREERARGASVTAAAGWQPDCIV